MTLRTDFAGDFSQSAFQTIDGEPYIVGKWGRISELDGGDYDCWYVGPDLKPLHGRRLAAIRKNLSVEGGITEGTGELWVRGRGRAFVLECARLAGVKRKRRLSAATKARLRRQLERVRPAA